MQQHCVATIGVFDGMHIGHQMLLRKTLEVAKYQNMMSMVILFEPYPQEYFGTQKYGRIMQFQDKVNFLCKFNIDIVVYLSFDKNLIHLSAERFIQVIIGNFRIKHLVVGDDFRFGNHRIGDFALLQALQDKYNYTVENHSTLKNNKQVRVSSSFIRKCLHNGQLVQAQKMLDRMYALCGYVVHGSKIGRTLGFPTLNIIMKQKMAIYGIFAVMIEGLADKIIQGVASLGYRPTFNQSQLILEVFCFDYNDDAYGKFIEVTFISKLRDERKFTSKKRLQQAIKCDVVRARRIFSTQKDEIDFINEYNNRCLRFLSD